MENELSQIEKRIKKQLIKSKISLYDAENKLLKNHYSKERVKNFMNKYLKEQFL